MRWGLPKGKGQAGDMQVRGRQTQVFRLGERLFSSSKNYSFSPNQAARAARISARMSLAASGILVPGPKIALTPADLRKS